MNISEIVRLNSVKRIVARTGLSRSTVYKEMDSGRLRSVKCGRRRLIPESALIDFIDTLIEATTGQASVDPDARDDADGARRGEAVVRP